MRLTNAQVETIKNAAGRVLGGPTRVWLFGSRTDDTLRGGDIDLFVETDVVLPNRAEALCRLHGELTLAFGERKLDIVLKDARTAEAPLFGAARRKGVLL